MAATPFVGCIVVKYKDGFQETINATMSDVTTNEWVAPDGGDFFYLNASHGDAKIVDILLSASGVDCRTSTINVNTKQIPEIVLHGANVGTVVSRQFQQSNLYLPAGAKLEFTQLT